MNYAGELSIDTATGRWTVRLKIEMRAEDGAASRWRVSYSGSGPGTVGQIETQLGGLVTEPGSSIDAAWLATLRDDWHRWHLNDMRPGSPTQMAWIRRYGAGWNYSSLATVAALQAAGLEPCPETGIRYGHDWHYEAPPRAELIARFEAAKVAAAEHNRRLSEKTGGDDSPSLLETLAGDAGLEPEELQALADHINADIQDARTYHAEHYAGQFRTPADAAREIVESIGETIPDRWPHRHIDWEAAGNELLDCDYFEISGHWYRNA